MVDNAPVCVHPPWYNVMTEAAMREADDIVKGHVPAKRYASFRELLADTEADD